MTPEARAAGLAIWSGPVTPEPLGGGITNRNFTVEDGGRRYVVRIGDDIPVHGVMRFNELAASRAAHAAGLSPEVVHHEAGALVLSFIDGKTLGEEDFRDPRIREAATELTRRCHNEIPRFLRGPALMFWVFHVLRDYAGALRDAASPHLATLAPLTKAAEALETAVGRIDVVFGHNDLLPANFIDDGARLWLIDWDYAGFNSPLFDLGGLAANNAFTEAEERAALAQYFGADPDDGLWRRYAAMKCASALRETMWSMVSELHSDLDFDYAAYTADNLGRFERAYSDFKAL